MAESDKITLDIAKLIKDDFLQQNGYSAYDRFCPFYKTTWMLRNIMAYQEKATHAVEVSNGQLSWNKIREATADLFYKLSAMKFEDPADGENVVRERYLKLNKEIDEKFRSMLDAL